MNISKQAFFGLMAILLAIGCAPNNARHKLKLTDLNGVEIPAGSFESDYLLVNFWATWCKPCIQELPSLHALQQALPDDVQIILVSNETTEKIQAFADKYDITLPVYSQSGAIEVFGLAFLPTTMLVGPDGNVLLREEGERVWDSPDMIDKIRDLTE